MEKWDMIVAVNDIPVGSTYELMTLIRKLKQEYIRLTIANLDERKSKIKEIPVEIIEDRILFKNPPKEVAEDK